ncbi:hypothetical protein FRB94_002819 [Tulasnella sp. JGI-2019a]|nr:hypothetical protein FRB94_002819 [Tulasnella sp. JGI-2019a]
MVVFTPQIAAAILAAMSISSAAAAAVPQRDHDAQHQQSIDRQVHMSLSRRTGDAAPIVSLPPKILAKMGMSSGSTSSSSSTPVEHHQEKKSDKKSKKGGKGKKHRRRMVTRAFTEVRPYVELGAREQSVAINRAPIYKRDDEHIHIHSHGDGHDHHHDNDDGRVHIHEHSHKRDHDHDHDHNHDHDHDHRRRATVVVKRDVMGPLRELSLLGMKVGRRFFSLSKRDHDHEHGHDHYRRIVKGSSPSLAFVKKEEAKKRSHDHDHDHGHHRRSLISVPGIQIDPYDLNSDDDLLHLAIGKREADGSLLDLSPPATSSIALGTFDSDSDGSNNNMLHLEIGKRNTGSQSSKRDDAGSLSGVEGVINIVSSVIDSAVGETLATLMLANDPQDNSAFVMNASNSTATHVFLVPANTTDASAASVDDSIPVELHVPVYSPESAAMLAYCVTYDPNPPAPAPLAAKPCVDRESAQSMDSHTSQIFSYSPTTGNIVPMWITSDPSAASEDNSTSTDPAAASTAGTSSNSTNPSAADAADSTPTSTSMAADPTSTVAASSGNMTRRSVGPYIIQAVVPSSSSSPAESIDDVSCEDNVQSLAVTAPSNSTDTLVPATAQTVSLVFTPSAAAGVLASNSTDPAAAPAAAPAAVPLSASSPASAPAVAAESMPMSDPNGSPPSGDSASAMNAGTSTDNSTSDASDGSDSVSPSSDSSVSAGTTDPSTANTNVLVAAMPAMIPLASASTPYSWNFAVGDQGN